MIKEISKLEQKIKLDGFSLIPLKIYLVRGKAKVLLGVGKGRKKYDKREMIKKRDNEREIRKILKYK